MAKGGRYEVVCGWQFQILQILLSTLPLLGFLIYFLYEAYTRPSKPIYELPYGSSEEEVLAAIEESGKLIPLANMITTCLSIAAVATCIAMYVSFFVPWHRRLVEEYLNNGKRIVGDVFYRPRAVCPRLSSKQGCAFYPHPDHENYPLYIRKHVMVYERYTREKVGLLLLPDQPFSGQCKADLKIELKRIERNHTKITFLQWYTWCWVLFSFLAPVFILFVMDDLVKDGAYYMNDFAEDTAQSWDIYAICAVAIPVGAALLTWLFWKQHHYGLVRGNSKFLQEGESRSGADWYEMTSEDEEDEDTSVYPSGSGYEPAPDGSVASMNRKQSIVPY